MDPKTGEGQNAKMGTGVTDTTADNSQSLEHIMTGDTGTKPDAKPAAGGEKAEGSSDGNAQVPAWMSQLPDELKSSAVLAKFGKLGDLAKAYQELAAKADGALQLPAKDAKPEDVQAFYEKLGQPKTAAEYEITGENADMFRAIAYNSHLTQSQAKSMYEAIVKVGTDAVAKRQQQMKTQYAETEAALKEEYGTHYQEKLELLTRGMRAYGNGAIQQKLQSAGLSFDPDIVRMFIRIGELTSEAPATGKGATGNGYTPNADGGMFDFAGLKK